MGEGFPGGRMKSQSLEADVYRLTMQDMIAKIIDIIKVCLSNICCESYYLW